MSSQRFHIAYVTWEPRPRRGAGGADSRAWDKITHGGRSTIANEHPAHLSRRLLHACLARLLEPTRERQQKRLRDSSDAKHRASRGARRPLPTSVLPGSHLQPEPHLGDDGPPANSDGRLHKRRSVPRQGAAEHAVTARFSQGGRSHGGHCVRLGLQALPRGMRSRPHGIRPPDRHARAAMGQSVVCRAHRRSFHPTATESVERRPASRTRRAAPARGVRDTTAPALLLGHRSRRDPCVQQPCLPP